MDLDSGVLAALTLGFLLRLKHATDADHVVAVSTIAGEFGNAWRGIWVGASWGLGHTTPLLLLGVVILLLKETVLDRYASVAPFLEFGVGVMLVFLGAHAPRDLPSGCRAGWLVLQPHSEGIRVCALAAVTGRDRQICAAWVHGIHVADSIVTDGGALSDRARRRLVRRHARALRALQPPAR